MRDLPEDKPDKPTAALEGVQGGAHEAAKRLEIESKQHVKEPEEPCNRVAEKRSVPEEDAPLKEILLYSFGNIESGLANGFYNLMNSLVGGGVAPLFWWAVWQGCFCWC